MSEDYNHKWGFSEPNEQAKRPIIIERPNGVIPGFLEVNEILAEKFGCVVVLCLNTGKEGNFVLANVELHKARVEGDEIVPYEVFK